VDADAAERLVRDARRFVERMATYVASKGIVLENRDAEDEHQRRGLSCGGIWRSLKKPRITL
jgi:hypothetical protein